MAEMNNGAASFLEDADRYSSTQLLLPPIDLQSPISSPSPLRKKREEGEKWEGGKKGVREKMRGRE